MSASTDAQPLASWDDATALLQRRRRVRPWATTRHFESGHADGLIERFSIELISVQIDGRWTGEKEPKPVMWVAWDEPDRVLFDGTTLGQHPGNIIEKRRMQALAMHGPPDTLVGRRVRVSRVPKRDPFDKPTKGWERAFALLDGQGAPVLLPDEEPHSSVVPEQLKAWASERRKSVAPVRKYEVLD